MGNRHETITRDPSGAFALFYGHDGQGGKLAHLIDRDSDAGRMLAGLFDKYGDPAEQQHERRLKYGPLFQADSSGHPSRVYIAVNPKSDVKVGDAVVVPIWESGEIVDYQVTTVIRTPEEVGGDMFLVKGEQTRELGYFAYSIAEVPQ